ncbi:hypothetical protein DC429_04855 [Arthrobacter sp. TPD3018]|nr:hypothetical protein DC429_04855 [Arthrobacter sp. TPD3018]
MRAFGKARWGRGGMVANRRSGARGTAEVDEVDDTLSSETRGPQRPAGIGGARGGWVMEGV